MFDRRISVARYMIRKVLTLFIIAVVSLMVFLLAPVSAPVSQHRLGFTYSVHAARYLGLDDTVFATVMSELKPEIVRIPVYWDIVEASSGMYDWRVYDEQLATAEANEAKVLLAIGHKLPRWPECHIPAWAESLSPEDVELALMGYVEAVVQRYKQHPALDSWQVENESLFPFGDCPTWSSDRERLLREISLVKSLDGLHPVITTDSGELSLWWRSASLPIDDLGISLYRVVYSNGRHFRWPLNPYFYRIRYALVKPFINNLRVTELQTEPWGSVDVLVISEDEIAASFPPQALTERYRYARQVGASDVLTWGVEWWYWRLLQGDSSYWSAAKALFSEQ